MCSAPGGNNPKYATAPGVEFSNHCTVLNRKGEGLLCRDTLGKSHHNLIQAKKKETKILIQARHSFLFLLRPSERDNIFL